MDTSETDPRVHLERDPQAHIARVTIDNPERRNAYDPAMRRAAGAYLDELATDDDIKVVILRGANGVFSTGADMQNSYSWYGADGEKRRPSQRRRLGVDRESFGFYHDYLTFPKVTIAQVETYALGGAFELALMSDIAVVGRDARLGMPGARLLGPALGNLHLFFYRLGPVLSRRLLLTGDTVVAGELEHLGIFTDVCEPDAVADAGRGLGAEGRADAGRRPGHRQDQLLADRTDHRLRGGGGGGLSGPRVRDQPPVRGRRVQLRQGPVEGRAPAKPSGSATRTSIPTSLREAWATAWSPRW